MKPEGEPEASLTPGGAPDARAAGRGSLALLVLQTGARVLALLFVVTVAREVSPSQFGRYSIVGGVVLFCGLLADFGTTTVITRRVSRNPADADRLLSGTLPASLALGLAAYAVAVTYAAAAGYGHEVLIDVVIGGASLPFTSALTSVQGALDGRGLIGARAQLTFLQSAIVTLGGAIPVLLGAGIRSAILAIPCGSAIALVVAALTARRRGLWTGSIGFDRNLSLLLLKQALPFALLGGLGAVYRRFDLLVLSLVGTRTQTADYDLALRVLEAVGYLGTVISAPALYILSRRIGLGDREGAQRAFTAASRAVYMVGLPVSAGAIALHVPLTRALFGSQYAGAAVPLAIVGAQIWLDFASGLQGALMLAGEYVTLAVRLEAGVMVLLMVLDVVLIARYTVNGAAAALCVFQLVNVVVFRRFNRQTAGVTLPLPPGSFVIAAAASGLAGWGAARLSIVAGLVAGAVVYGVVVIALGGITPADREMLGRILRRD